MVSSSSSDSLDVAGAAWPSSSLAGTAALAPSTTPHGPSVTVVDVGNVTDSLDAIGREVERARNCIAPAATFLLDGVGPPSAAYAIVQRRVMDTIVILDDLSDMVRREHEALAEVGNLLQTLVCGHCETEYEVAAGPVGLRTYCSSRCRQAAYRMRAARQQS